MIAADGLEHLFPHARLELLGIGEPFGQRRIRENHRRRHHRTGERTAADLVHPGNGTAPAASEILFHAAIAGLRNEAGKEIGGGQGGAGHRRGEGG